MTEVCRECGGEVGDFSPCGCALAGTRQYPSKTKRNAPHRSFDSMREMVKRKLANRAARAKQGGTP